MTKDKALKLALEALEKISKTEYHIETPPIESLEEKMRRIAYKAITAIKEALMSGTDGAQPEQEPVAWRTYTGRGYYIIDATLEEAQKNWPDREHQPLYTTPPQRPSRSDIKPLTAMEVYDVVHDADLDWHTGFALGEDENRFVVFARAIEAVHGIIAPTELKEEV